MKHISHGLTGQFIILLNIVYLFFSPFARADEIATRSVVPDQQCMPEIHIQVNLPENQHSYAIEERIPTGLIPSNISHDGIWDSENHIIKWGLFNDHETPHLSYQVSGRNASIELKGRISIDGTDQQITGVSEVLINCMPEKEKLSSPVFDPPGGAIVPVLLNITSNENNALIRYTLDGSLPDETSTLYTGPINIDSHSVVRAATFKPDYLPGDAVTATYYDSAPVKILRTIFDTSTCSPGIKLSVTVNENIHAIAIIETLSNGLYPENITNNGVWDPESRTIKWGLFHDKSSYELRYHVRGIKGDYELSTNASVNGTPVDTNEPSSISLSCDIQQVERPIFQPASGTPFPTTVEISCDPPDAIIHYTLDNSLPDQNSPVYSTPLSITSATKIKVMAYKSGMIESPLAIGIFPEPTIEHTVLSRIIDPGNSCFPDITITIEPIFFTRAIAINEIIPKGLYPFNISNYGVWDEKNRKIKWGLFYTHEPIQIKYQLTGMAGDFLLNGDGSFDGRSVTIKGDTAITLDCSPGLNIVANPVFVTSENAVLPVEISMTCDTPGALIYYSTNGSIPDQNAFLYSKGFTINSKTVIRARAFKAEMVPSEVVTKAYLVTLSEKPYAINRTIQYLSLCANTVHIDLTPHHSVQSYAYEEHLPTGVDPTEISENGIFIENKNLIRWGLFNDDQNKTLSYSINLPDGLYQLQGDFSYDGQTFQEEIATITSECSKDFKKIKPVIITPDSGTQVPATISMQCETPGATIYYTTNGQLPDQSSLRYENPITINSATIIRAIALKAEMEPGDVVTSYYKNPPLINTIHASLTNDNSCLSHITIKIEPATITPNYAVEVYLDEALMPLNISHQGRWDERTHTIRWGLFHENEELSYDIHGNNGTHHISGKISVNGASMPALDTLTVSFDCQLSIEQGNSIIAFLNEDGAFSLPPINVIGSDPESFKWDLAEAPLHATVTVSGVGFSPEINYQPDTNWYGSDYFIIKVSDKNDQMDFIRVNVMIHPVNDPPIFQLETTEILLNEDFSTPLFLTIITLSPPFGEEETIDYRLSPAEAEFTNILVDSSNKRIRVTAKPNANGSETIQLIANDGEKEYSETIHIDVLPVNDPPLFDLSENAVTLTENFSFEKILTVIPSPVPSDEKHQHTTYELQPDSVNFANIVIHPDSGEIIITATPDQNGSQIFTVIADDGQPKNSKAYQSLTLTILKGSDPPEFIPGDINNDGLLDCFDLVVMLSLVSNFEVPGDLLFINDADINLSGDIDLVDVLYVFHQVVARQYDK